MEVDNLAYEKLLHRLKSNADYAEDVIAIVRAYNDAKKMMYGINRKTAIYNHAAVKYGVYWLKEGYLPEDMYKVFIWMMSWAKAQGFVPTIDNCLRYTHFESYLDQAEMWFEKDHKYIRLLSKTICNYFEEYGMPSPIKHDDPVMLKKIEAIYTAKGKVKFSAIERTVEWMSTWPAEYPRSPLTLVKSPERFDEYLLQSKLFFAKETV